MTDEKIREVRRLRKEGRSIRVIATITGLWPSQVSRALNPLKYLLREDQLRAEKTSIRKKCGQCGEAGHNKNTCEIRNGKKS